MPCPARFIAAALVAAVSATSASAQDHLVNFTSLGTFTTSSLDIDHLSLTADDGTAPGLVNVLNLNGLGVVGGLTDTMCDANEALHFAFDTPVIDVHYTVFVANNIDGDGLVGEHFLEAFDGATSLGVIPQNDTGFHFVSQLFGGVPITSFTVRADGEGNRIDTLAYTVNPWSNVGPGLAGTHGVGLLEGTGSLKAGSNLEISASSLLENHVSTLVLGYSTVLAPFKGGVLGPNPDVIIPGLLTGSLGSFTVSDTVPAGLPSGFSFYTQVWWTDVAGPVGFAATNTLGATAP